MRAADARPRGFVAGLTAAVRTRRSGRSTRTPRRPAQLEHRPRGVKAGTSTRRARGHALGGAGFSETIVTAPRRSRNKEGNFGFHVGTTASYSTTMRTADGTGSGSAGFESPRLGDVKAANLAARAAKKAQTSVDAKDLPPGAYTGHPRAARRHGPPRQPLLVPDAAHRGRGTELPLEAGRRKPHRRGGLREARHAAFGPVRPASLRAVRGRAEGGRAAGLAAARSSASADSADSAAGAPSACRRGKRRGSKRAS